MPSVLMSFMTTLRCLTTLGGQLNSESSADKCESRGRIRPSGLTVDALNARPVVIRRM
jgi:hypothetical protein